MSIFQKSQVQSLSEWLEIATRKLTDASKQRIRAEIEVHYAEAAETHREAGLSESDAQTKSLMDLGDAKAAARRFRKRHLAESEVRTLKYLEKIGRSIVHLMASYCVFAGFALDQFSHQQRAHTLDPYRIFGLVLEFLVLIALPTVCFAIAKFGRSKPNKHLVLLQAVSGIFPGYVLGRFFSEGFVPFGDWLYFVFALTLLAQLEFSFRIWLKLGKARLIGSQTPPTAPAQS